ncbi:MFS general substrate transporter [Pseudohyphozyma bogoriensis]|nr:MFS general substrate transporter [Pseudohyphozyma bogoriensis]
MTSKLAGLLKQLKPFGACDVADALTRLKHPYGGFIEGLVLRSPDFQAGSTRIMGPAYTVLFEKNEEKGRKPQVPGHYIDTVPEGSILYLSAPAGLPNAVYGGIMSARAKHLGAVGTIVDGRIRDLQEHRDKKWPVFSRGVGIAAGAELCFPSQLGVSVPVQSLEQPGVFVNNGDILVGDIDGVVAIPEKLLEDVVRILPELAAVDQIMEPSTEKGTIEQREFGTRFAAGDAIHPSVTLDTEKGSTAYASSEIGITHVKETAKAERKLLFKLDILILPLAVLLYVSAYLDRGNLGNARLQGLQETVLNGSDTAYSIALCCFFITYILLSVPGTLLSKAIQPSTAISAGALIWSIAATCQAAAFHPAGLYVCRLFVGVGESFFGHTSKYLNEDERTLAHTRLNADTLVEGHTGIDWRAVKRAMTDWKSYVIAVAYSCSNLALGSVGGFLPTIIKGLGYTNAKSQLMTVPPYVVALVFVVTVTTISDRKQTRGLVTAFVFCVGLTGWIILLAVSPVKPSSGALKARYFACFLIVCGGYSNSPILIAWQSNNTGCESQRATSLGLLNSVGQCLSILAAFVFPSTEAPRYIKGIALNIAFQVLGFCVVVGMSLYYRWENRRRDTVEGPAPPKGTALNVLEEYDLAPGFRYTP